MEWNRMRDRIGLALTGVESYEHRQARLSEDTPERILLDLIAELRDVSDNRALRLDLADWAEDRLREVSDE